MEALDYHAENNSISIQVTKRGELLPSGFTSPLRAKRDKMEAIPDDPKLNLIESPNLFPLADSDMMEYTPSHFEGEPEQAGEEPKVEVTAADKAEDTTSAGVPIPEEFHWDGQSSFSTGPKTTSPATSSQLGSIRSPCAEGSRPGWEVVPTPDGVWCSSNAAESA